MSFSDEFLSLPLEKVRDVLQWKQIAVQTEDAIFDTVLRWVRRDIDNRQCHLEDLVTNCVHITRLDERYVKVGGRFLSTV